MFWSQYIVWLFGGLDRQTLAVSCVSTYPLVLKLSSLNQALLHRFTIFKINQFNFSFGCRIYSRMDER